MKKQPEIIREIKEIKFVPKSLKDMHKEDMEVIKVLNLNEIRHIIAYTDKGDLALMIRKGETERQYHFVLDAVPVGEAENKELTKVFNNVLYTI